MTVPAVVGYPRFFVIARHRINSYKFFLVVGIGVGTLATAGLADSSGLSPLRTGAAAMFSALIGLVGARAYHVVIHFRSYVGTHALWDSSGGGMSVFGALLTFVPASYVAAGLVGVRAVTLWDLMGIGVLAGGFWIRLGCVFNGCCAGRGTDLVFGLPLHDTRKVVKRRIPVQFLEMGLWAIGLAAFIGLWPTALPVGGYALAVLAWYGVGRFFLEPLRERPDVIGARLRINQLVAGLIAVSASLVLLAH